MTITWEQLGIFTDLFQPGRVPPTTEQFDQADREHKVNADKLSEQSFSVNLIGTDAVRKCVSAVLHFFLGFEKRLYDAGSFFRGTPFDALSKTVPLNQQDKQKFGDLINGFSYWAREDLGVGNSTPDPKGSCD
jgi:hypothetical protein